MAVPRVFISSTYYDLKQVRSIVGDFIEDDLGYNAVMHERSGVAYTQNEPLEEDCYRELAGCDIVVCIIGNHFGTKSSDNDLSITMKELETAIKEKKKIYVFISNDVFIENRTYRLNKGTGSFRSAYTDDIKIHEFIAKLMENEQNYVILPFETADQIIPVLKSQFAGLFQNLLAGRASLNNGKTADDLHTLEDQVRILQDENTQLKAEIDVLKKEKDIDGRIIRHRQPYLTLRDDDMKLKYCAICWDDEQKLIQMSETSEATTYSAWRTLRCHKCHNRCRPDV